MNRPIAEQTAEEMAAEFLMNVAKMKKKDGRKLKIMVKTHMERVIVRYLDLLRSKSPGEFAVETDARAKLDMKMGVAIKIVSGNLEYVGYIEEINVLGKNKHIIN